MSIISEIREEIAKLHAQLTAIQDNCSHPDPCHDKKYGASTGHYDPSNDSYWITHTCSLCEKRWTTEQ